MSRMKAWGVLVVLVVFSVAAMGQTYEGRILGTVTDQSGGVVRDVRVTITNVDTGVSRSLVTNEAGDYVAPNLPPGVYKISVEAAGFKKIERLGVRLEVAKDARIDFVLLPGAVTESVKVTEQAPLVETTNDVLGGSFANKAINDLPLNGREYQNLVVLRPGVQRSPGGGFLSISSNGNRPEDNNFIFDGIDNNDPYYGAQVINTEGVQGTPGSILPIDAIQEFNAVENPPAEYGWKPGAVVNLGIKSGTNEVHGTAYYFGRNDNLDARNFFNPVPDPQRELRLHQFGGSIGGPIRKNKTFIFGAYEGVRALVANSETLASPATVSVGNPTVSIPDAIANVTARCATSAVPCGVSPLSLKLSTLYPANDGKNPSGPGLLNIGFPNRNRNDNFILKGDHHFNEHHSIAARYFFGDSLQVERDIPVLRPEWQSQSQYRAQVVGVNYTWNPTARWVNEAKFGYNRFWQAILTVDHDKDPKTTYGINTGVTKPIDFGMPEIALNSFNSLGGNHGWPLLTIPNETYVFSDNVSYTIGRHTLRFGGEFRRGSTHNIRDRFGKSRIRFSGGELSALCNCYPAGTPSSDLEDFIAGLPRGTITGKTGGRIFIGDSERFVSMLSFGAFLQDDWRVTPRFMVNAGVRYDLNSTIRERQNRLANFDPVNGIRQVGRGIGSPYDTDFNNVAPRLGIAWDPWGKGKTVIRAGGGIIYEIPHFAIFLGQNGVNNASTPGLNVIPTSPSSGIPGANGTILATATNFSGSSLNWTVAGPVFQPSINCNPLTGGTPCDILGVPRNLRTPYVATWNLNIQQAIGSSLSVQVGYVGNRGIKQYSIRDINQVNVANDDGTEQPGRPFTFNCPAPVGGGAGGPCFPFLEFVNFMENGYTSIYHGLQVSVTQRPWHGLTYVLGYTWSHSIDFASLNRAAQPQDSNRPKLERGNSDLDLRHRLTVALTYNLPSRKGWGQLLEGWQINSIVTVQTGSPWGLTDGFVNGNDISLTGEFSDRWNIFGDPRNIHFSTSGSVPFFDPTTFTIDPVTGKKLGNPDCIARADFGQLQSFGCFEQGGTVLVPPNAGTFGNMGRNTFLGPRLDNWDFSLVKTTKITERFDIQFRAEFFNVLNHPHFANPGGLGGGFGNIDPSVPSTFGFASATPDVGAANPVIGTGGARNIQLGVKFRF